MEMVCFVEVGISEYKCILLCLSCFKHYMELNSVFNLYAVLDHKKRRQWVCKQ